MKTYIQFLVLLISLIFYHYNSLQAQVKNLDSLFISKPSDSERDAIIKAFNITLKDGDESYAKWDLYDPYNFNPSSTKPSIYPLINSLRVLREQKLTEALPFTNDAYQYMLSRLNWGGIELSLRTGYNYGSNNWIYLCANASFWDGRPSDTPFKPYPNFSVMEYVYGNQLLLHETRHNDPDDPGHDPNIAGKDTRFSLEGAYARDAIYFMWIYKYGLNNSQSIKLAARDQATNTLIDRFVEMPPTHPNPKVQNLINELLPKIGVQSGNFQKGRVGEILPNLLKVNIYFPYYNTEPIYTTNNVFFRVISVPPNSSGYALSSNSSSTLSGEPASVSFKLGDKPGKYLISANAPSFGKDSVVFSLTANTSPVANAGPDQSVCEGSLVVLDGSASTDLDEDPLKLKWAPPAGIILNYTSAAIRTFIAPNISKVTIYTFNLVVNDGLADSPVDQVNVVVNPLPSTPIITQNGKILSSNATSGNQWYNQNNPIIGATTQDYTITTVGEYTVQVTLNGCISSPSNMIKDVVTSITSLEYNEKIKVYPNPVSDDLTIEFKGNTDEIKYAIYSSSGQLITTGVLLESTVVHTSSFSSGLYTIKFNTGKTFDFRKVIKHN